MGSKKTSPQGKNMKKKNAKQQMPAPEAQQEGMFELTDADLGKVVGGIMKTKHDTVKN